MVEEDGADIVQMPIQREETAASLIGPDFDLIVITS